MEQWVTAASALLAFLLYYNTLDAGFVYDDRRAILSNPDVIGHTPIKALFENDFWGTPLTDPGSHGSYRPLCVASYRLNYALSGFKPWSYHFLNILFHSVATALVVTTARRLLPAYCTRVGSAVAGLSFAAHPIHTEAVAGVVGRADLAACNFFLLSFLLYCEHSRLRNEHQRKPCRHINKDLTHRQLSINVQILRFSCHGFFEQIATNFRKLLKASKIGTPVMKTCDVDSGTLKLKKCQCNSDVSAYSYELMQWFTLAGTLLFATAATLCKEPGIMVVPLCILYDLLRDTRHDESSLKYRWRSIFALGTGGFILLFWRLKFKGNPSPFATADNPTARDPSFFTRLYTFAYLPVFNFFLLLYPFHLSFDWSMDSIPRITSISDPRNISTVLFYVALSKVTWRAFLMQLKIFHDKKIKFYKKAALKIKSKWNYNCKKQMKLLEIERRTVIANSIASKPSMCPCNGCKHSLTMDHTSVCRIINNNNTLMHNSNCICVKPQEKVKEKETVKVQIAKKYVYSTPQASIIVFIAFMVLPFVPACNILFYVGFVVAERVLYIPSIGFCLLLGLGAGSLTRNWNRNEIRCRIFMFALMITLLTMCGCTLRRNLDWHDEESLFRSALHINPPKAYGNLGSVLTTQGRIAEAEVAFGRALKYRPNMADVHYNLGILLAYVNLGTSLMADGRLSEAASALRTGARVEGLRVRDRREHDAARVSALVQLATLHSQRGHFHKALSAYKEALQILPDTNAPVVGWTRHSVLSMAGDIYIQLQQWPQAEHSILSALAVAPKDLGTHITLAQILARNTSRALEAEMWFKRAVTLAPDDPSVRDQFGMFLRSQRRLRESAEQLVRAAQLSPADGARAAAAARALRDARRCRSAERWYARAVELNPEDAAYHSNLGAILHLNGKYAAAAASYRRALQLQPNDEITITNLKRVRTLMSKQRRK
ncbi:PREDICTED: transmembrane and TPR repeat-containing protein CG31690-like [Papilio xuthus]|uniref:dolichyl-phosphate-mannose--protein mannosyltransferase n=2 Tax=Papilio xuthus TaxID=66420 RepID=A0AAJ6ZM53_PAPXU|nr:PREDICTED: transmembrane and TPR repeat-containing protein CG31690-like [Papilio xuthus]